jgi:hypothetical protein
MADYDLKGDAASGFGGYFTRFFSIFTLIGGIFVGSDEIDLFQDPDKNLYMGIWLLFLGVHGVFTKLKSVGIIRQLLCYLSGVAGAMLAFNIISQLINV